MTKIYPIISLNSELYMIDKEAECPKDSWAIFPNTKNGEIKNFEGCSVTKCKWDYAANGNSNLRVVASTDKTLGLPLLPSIELTFEEKVARVLRQIFVKNQEYALAAMVRDYMKDLKVPIPTSVEVEMDIDNPCPKCGTENVHGNYDYSKKELPLIDNLCNECGEFFNPIPEVDENNFVKIIKWI